MQFASDNWAGAHPRIVEAILREAARYDGAYGAAEADRAAQELFCELFGREVAIFLVGTGTAANGLALAATARPGGIVICHRQSHIELDECGGIAHQGDGMRLKGLDGPVGKIHAATVRAEIASFPASHVHAGQLAAVSLTQATEAGTIYDIAEIAAVSAEARGAGLPVHVDGARFANAVARLGVSPAEMTVDAGVDLLTFGGTKNGCINAEAVIVFEPALAGQLAYLRMRAGHLSSKSRFIAAQFVACLQGGLWLELAGHSNAMADRLRAGIANGTGCRPAWPTQTNEVFAVVKRERAARLRQRGALFHEWPSAGVDIGADECVVRLVTSFETTEDDVDRFVGLVED